MSSRKQRAIMRERRMMFSRRVEENRKKMEKFIKEKVETDKGFTVLENMTKQELIAYAYEHDIKIDKYAKKSDIIDTIKKVSE